jgi:hypothetical protein
MATTLVLAILIIAIIVGIAVLIVKLTKAKSVNSQAFPGGPTASAAGWYPDPSDPSSIRYFDGQSWTSHTQPGG